MFSAADQSGGGVWLSIPNWLVFYINHTNNISFSGNTAGYSGKSIYSLGTKITWSGLCPLVNPNSTPLALLNLGFAPQPQETVPGPSLLLSCLFITTHTPHDHPCPLPLCHALRASTAPL